MTFSFHYTPTDVNSGLSEPKIEIQKIKQVAENKRTETLESNCPSLDTEGMITRPPFEVKKFTFVVFLCDQL